jgi:tRNA G10  N-methylase Trm11
MQSLLILGRQPALGLAELESLYGADKLQPLGSQAVIIDVDPCLLAFDRLGGATKFCKVLTILPTTNWKKIEQFLRQTAPGHSQQMAEGKLRLGLSLYGFTESLKQIEATGLELKKNIRTTGRSVRLVPNKSTELNAAQILHNQLTGPTGWELVFVRNGEQTVIAQTVKVQNIASYSRRDRERPKRDTKVGMLPPKLAQVLINLAVGKMTEDSLVSICDIPEGQPIPRPILNQTVLDPFCGTGVLLQEALLMGYDVQGSDIEPRMIAYAKQNLAWLSDLYNLPAEDYTLEVGDATRHSWRPPTDLVATETYLGRPFTARPDPEILARTVSECNTIIKKSLQNLHGRLQPGARLCLAVPAWQTHPQTFKHLPLIDQISDLGYNRVSFEHVRDDDLLYYREDQFVGRQLLVLIKQ